MSGRGERNSMKYIPKETMNVKWDINTTDNNILLSDRIKSEEFEADLNIQIKVVKLDLIYLK